MGRFDWIPVGICQGLIFGNDNFSINLLLSLNVENLRICGEVTGKITVPFYGTQRTRELQFSHQITA